MKRRLTGLNLQEAAHFLLMLSPSGGAEVSFLIHHEEQVTDGSIELVDQKLKYLVHLKT